jgi:hypothetical protein
MRWPTHWLSDDQLLALIPPVHAKYRQAYGSPRITEELKPRGITVTAVTGDMPYSKSLNAGVLRWLARR